MHGQTRPGTLALSPSGGLRGQLRGDSEAPRGGAGGSGDGVAEPWSSDLVNRQLRAAGPDRLRVADLKQVLTGEEWLYLG